jgi:uncharacterized protein (TIGR02145 family)
MIPPSPAAARRHRGWKFPPAPALAGSVCLLLLIPFQASRALAAAGDSLAYPLAVTAGWNLLALPLLVADPSTSTLFPTAVSNAFVYDSAYRTTDTLWNGDGFWLKFPSAETLSIGGHGDFRDTIPLRAGWNLIGGITTPAVVATIRSVPAGIVASKYFSFAGAAGYSAADTLRPGAGYMVKASGAGLLILTSLDTPCPGVEPLAYGGHTYHGVQIGEQCWIRENMNIGEVVFAGLDQLDNGVIEKYCWIDEEYNCTIYGALYQWNEAMQYSTAPGSRGICPSGWHIPTLQEFKTLDTITGGNANQLKALRQGAGDGMGTNLTGFGALLSGYRHLDGSFSMLGFQAYYWTSSEHDTLTVPGFYLFYYYSDFYFYPLERGYGVNIRCLRD